MHGVREVHCRSEGPSFVVYPRSGKRARCWLLERAQADQLLAHTAKMALGPNILGRSDLSAPVSRTCKLPRSLYMPCGAAGRCCQCQWRPGREQVCYSHIGLYQALPHVVASNKKCFVNRAPHALKRKVRRHSLVVLVVCEYFHDAATKCRRKLAHTHAVQATIT